MGRNRKPTKKKANKTKPKPKPIAKKGPRQTSLPGMQDRAIDALEDAALSYAEIRDQRMGLTEQETEAKGKLLSLMHKHQKTSYRHGNVVIDVVPEGEKVKVKILKEGEEAPSKRPTSEEIDQAEEIPDYPDQQGEEPEPLDAA